MRHRPTESQLDAYSVSGSSPPVVPGKQRAVVTDHEREVRELLLQIVTRRWECAVAGGVRSGDCRFAARPSAAVALGGRSCPARRMAVPERACATELL
jgi:hypothetical protein